MLLEVYSALTKYYVHPASRLEPLLDTDLHTLLWDETIVVLPSLHANNFSIYLLTGYIASLSASSVHKIFDFSSACQV